MAIRWRAILFWARVLSLALKKLNSLLDGTMCFLGENGEIYAGVLLGKFADRFNEEIQFEPTEDNNGFKAWFETHGVRFVDSWVTRERMKEYELHNSDLA